MGPDPSNEGEAPPRKADSYRVPLRHACWLLLAVIAGTAIGFKIGLPSSDPAATGSAASVTPGAASGLAFAPATGRRPVKAVGLYTGRTLSPGLQRLSGVDAESLALSGTDELPGDALAAASVDAPYARDLTFLAFPSGTEPPATRIDRERRDAAQRSAGLPEDGVGPVP